MDGKVADINLQPAWKITRGDKKIVIAIIDVGFDDKKLNLSKVYGLHRKDILDEFQKKHGSECARIASSVAQHCTIIPVRVPAGASQKLLSTVFLETAQIANVISCSWGPVPSNSPLTRELFQVIEKVGERSVICFSAGNYNAPINDPYNKEFFWLDESTNMYQITKGPILNGYAAHPDVIAVGACTSLNKKAAYSNWGKEIAVCAPSDNYHPLCRSFGVKGRFTDFGGTSNACPLVAGVAALMLSANPSLSPKNIRIILEMTSDKIESFKGKVNAGAAVMLAKKLTQHTSGQFILN